VAELARRGLLLPARLPATVPLVLNALNYDVRRGAHSVGTHVRDAACFVCWAFARAYAPDVMRPYVLSLAQGMLTCAVFDRELNCRRAASAAFQVRCGCVRVRLREERLMRCVAAPRRARLQENVGRQGHQNFQHGIEILTMADYFTLGNRPHAYLEVSVNIAQFPQYRYALWEHLAGVKLYHWDADIRDLAAKTLGRFAGRDVDYAIATTLPELLIRTTSQQVFERHGSVLAIAEMIVTLSQHGAALSEETLTAIRNIVPRVEKARAYRGRGGEFVRAAVCRLIECMCLAKHPLSRRAALRLLDTLEDCLKHPYDSIQRGAAAALRHVAACALRCS
jgi:hypothetical protein